jgi:hypothetical protein
MEIQKKLIMKGLQIAVDFDGTCVTHDYPLVGKDIGAIPILKRLVEEGHSLILWTMRSGKELNDAIKWFESNGIKLYGIQENPTQSSWTTSPKAYAQLYIDDAALGCPLIINNKLSSRPFVNWNEVEKILFK